MHTTDALMIFARVGELGSLSAAGRLLSLPKANVSRAVTKLEREYGTTLLERTTRGVRLTEVGNLVHLRAMRIVDEVESTKAEVAAYKGEPEGLLRIGCGAFLGTLFLSARLPNFLSRYPKIKLHLHLANRLVPRADRFDAVLHVGLLGDSSYISRKIADIEMGLVATPEYLNRRGTPSGPDDLIGHTFMSAVEPFLEEGELPVRHNDLIIGKGQQRHALRLDDRVRTNDPVLIDAMMREGECIALASVASIADDLKVGRLVRILPDWRLLQEPAVYALHTFRSAIPTKLKVFLEFIETIGRENSLESVRSRYGVLMSRMTAST
jgi:LysR family transcriptional regulator, regulator for bpeEF and oprC